MASPRGRSESVIGVRIRVNMHVLYRVWWMLTSRLSSMLLATKCLQHADAAK